ncbi:hypothetical protein AKJ16_DCAP14870 [Drosera capensis]
MQKDDARLAKGGMVHDSSIRTEPKCGHQWLVEGAEAELLPNKKQAVGVPSNHPFPGILNQNLFPWRNISGFHPSTGPFDDQTARTMNFDDRNTSSITAGNSEMVGKGVDVDFQNDFPFGLSISHNVGEPRPSLNYGGNGRVQVSQVQDECPISMGLAYSGGDNTFISTGQSSSFMPIGQSFNSREGNNILTGHDTFSKEDVNINFMGQSVGRADGSMSSSSTYKVNDDKISIGLSNFNGIGGSLSMGQLFEKAGSNIISFGGYNDNGYASGRLHDLLTDQPSVQRSDMLYQKGLVVADANDTVASTALATASTSDISSKKKEEQKSSKRMPPNTFPANVRSLLSTGMLDGIQVKYIAWSRVKELLGVIKGSGYLCGCQTCNFSKVVSAFEFEQHASCKTKHPNNHIYFENGKTIYGVVQELRSTPQNMLFDNLSWPQRKSFSEFMARLKGRRSLETTSIRKTGVYLGSCMCLACKDDANVFCYMPYQELINWAVQVQLFCTMPLFLLYLIISMLLVYVSQDG